MLDLKIVTEGNAEYPSILNGVRSFTFNGVRSGQSYYLNKMSWQHCKDRKCIKESRRRPVVLLLQSLHLETNKVSHKYLCLKPVLMTTFFSSPSRHPCSRQGLCEVKFTQTELRETSANNEDLEGARCVYVCVCECVFVCLCVYFFVNRLEKVI